jgi:hypothetical protein
MKKRKMFLLAYVVVLLTCSNGFVKAESYGEVPSLTKAKITSCTTQQQIKEGDAERFATLFDYGVDDSASHKYSIIFLGSKKGYKFNITDEAGRVCAPSQAGADEKFSPLRYNSEAGTWKLTTSVDDTCKPKFAEVIAKDDNSSKFGQITLYKISVSLGSPQSGSSPSDTQTLVVTNNSADSIELVDIVNKDGKKVDDFQFTGPLLVNPNNSVSIDFDCSVINNQGNLKNKGYSRRKNFFIKYQVGGNEATLPVSVDYFYNNKGYLINQLQQAAGFIHASTQPSASEIQAKLDELKSTINVNVGVIINVINELQTDINKVKEEVAGDKFSSIDPVSTREQLEKLSEKIQGAENAEDTKTFKKAANLLDTDSIFENQQTEVKCLLNFISDISNFEQKFTDIKSKIASSGKVKVSDLNQTLADRDFPRYKSLAAELFTKDAAGIYVYQVKDSVFGLHNIDIASMEQDYAKKSQYVASLVVVGAELDSSNNNLLNTKASNDADFIRLTTESEAITRNYNSASFSSLWLWTKEYRLWSLSTNSEDDIHNIQRYIGDTRPLTLGEVTKICSMQAGNIAKRVYGEDFDPKKYETDGSYKVGNDINRVWYDAFLDTFKRAIEDKLEERLRSKKITLEEYAHIAFGMRHHARHFVRKHMEDDGLVEKLGNRDSTKYETSGADDDLTFEKLLERKLNKQKEKFERKNPGKSFDNASIKEGGFDIEEAYRRIIETSTTPDGWIDKYVKHCPVFMSPSKCDYLGEVWLDGKQKGFINGVVVGHPYFTVGVAAGAIAGGVATYYVAPAILAKLGVVGGGAGVVAEGAVGGAGNGINGFLDQRDLRILQPPGAFEFDCVAEMSAFPLPGNHAQMQNIEQAAEGPLVTGTNRPAAYLLGIQHQVLRIIADGLRILGNEEYDERINQSEMSEEEMKALYRDMRIKLDQLEAEAAKKKEVAEKERQEQARRAEKEAEEVDEPAHVELNTPNLVLAMLDILRLNGIEREDLRYNRDMSQKELETLIAEADGLLKWVVLERNVNGKARDLLRRMSDHRQERRLTKEKEEQKLKEAEKPKVATEITERAALQEQKAPAPAEIERAQRAEEARVAIVGSVRSRIEVLINKLDASEIPHKIQQIPENASEVEAIEALKVAKQVASDAQAVRAKEAQSLRDKLSSVLKGLSALPVAIDGLSFDRHTPFKELEKKLEDANSLLAKAKQEKTRKEAVDKEIKRLQGVKGANLDVVKPGMSAEAAKKAVDKELALLKEIQAVVDEVNARYQVFREVDKEITGILDDLSKVVERERNNSLWVRAEDALIAQENGLWMRIRMIQDLQEGLSQELKDLSMRQQSFYKRLEYLRSLGVEDPEFNRRASSRLKALEEKIKILSSLYEEIKQKMARQEIVLVTIQPSAEIGKGALVPISGGQGDRSVAGSNTGLVLTPEAEAALSYFGRSRSDIAGVDGWLDSDFRKLARTLYPKGERGDSEPFHILVDNYDALKGYFNHGAPPVKTTLPLSLTDGGEASLPEIGMPLSQRQIVTGLIRTDEERKEAQARAKAQQAEKAKHMAEEERIADEKRKEAEKKQPMPEVTGQEEWVAPGPAVSSVSKRSDVSEGAATGLEEEQQQISKKPGEANEHVDGKNEALKKLGVEDGVQQPTYIPEKTRAKAQRAEKAKPIAEEEQMQMVEEKQKEEEIEQLMQEVKRLGGLIVSKDEAAEKKAIRLFIKQINLQLGHKGKAIIVELGPNASLEDLREKQKEAIERALQDGIKSQDIIGIINGIRAKAEAQQAEKAKNIAEEERRKKTEEKQPMPKEKGFRSYPVTKDEAAEKREIRGIIRKINLQLGKKSKAIIVELGSNASLDELREYKKNALEIASRNGIELQVKTGAKAETQQPKKASSLTEEKRIEEKKKSLAEEKAQKNEEEKKEAVRKAAEEQEKTRKVEVEKEIQRLKVVKGANLDVVKPEMTAKTAHDAVETELARVKGEERLAEEKHLAEEKARKEAEVHHLQKQLSPVLDELSALGVATEKLRVDENLPVKEQEKNLEAARGLLEKTKQEKARTEQETALVTNPSMGEGHGGVLVPIPAGERGVSVTGTAKDTGTAVLPEKVNSALHYFGKDHIEDLSIDGLDRMHRRMALGLHPDKEGGNPNAFVVLGNHYDDLMKYLREKLLGATPQIPASAPPLSLTDGRGASLSETGMLLPQQQMKLTTSLIHTDQELKKAQDKEAVEKAKRRLQETEGANPNVVQVSMTAEGAHKAAEKEIVRVQEAKQLVEEKAQLEVVIEPRKDGLSPEKVDEVKKAINSIDDINWKLVGGKNRFRVKISGETIEKYEVAKIVEDARRQLQDKVKEVEIKEVEIKQEAKRKEEEQAQEKLKGSIAESVGNFSKKT